MGFRLVKLMNRIVVTTKDPKFCPKSKKLSKNIHQYYNLSLEQIKINKIYEVHKNLSTKNLDIILQNLLFDPVLESAKIDDGIDQNFDWTVEIGFKPGLTDTLGKTAQTTIEDFLREKFENTESVKTYTQYQFKGPVSYEDIQKISEELLANPLVEEIKIFKSGEDCFEVIDIDIDDPALFKISKKRGLALNLPEMQAIKNYFLQKDILGKREKLGLPAGPTDVELEALAQTWSEHCKHKIFNAKINYFENGTHFVIDSLFDTYIKSATEKLSKKIDWLVSVFSDNAGIIRFNDDYNLAFKVETHNSPSALDPYGGALTGILGVNRDIMGAGLGARLIANTDVFCFADPNYKKELPKRLLHPKRVFEGVRLGVEHGGNKSGIPTVNGSIIFDDSYLGKPLVFCGSLGISPKEIDGRPTHIKEILPEDRIIVAGGRTGKDGIHGATFSSEELNEQSPTSAVQIGDPFTQKKLHDFLIEARDLNLFRTVTDNGAGGFSSSVGELAILSGGCEILLEKAPLKYIDLMPWEILLSESQERMTFAVEPNKFEKLKELALVHEVEIADIGTFTDSGYFHVLFQGKSVCHLDMDFLHNGCPKMELEAVWDNFNAVKVELPDTDLKKDLTNLLKSDNISSREDIIRQYDTEVQGGTILKPLTGVNVDGPSDSAIVQPIECLGSKRAIVISNGICPKFSLFDTYHMAASAIDEAIRNAVSSGCDPKQIAILDNFSWPDPIYNPLKTLDGKYKLAQLVRANKALYEYSLAFEAPIISGKDSMKNDYKIENIKISVLPTLLISLIGIIPDIETAVSVDVKAPGDFVYIVGMTKKELGGSEYFRMKNIVGGSQPKVDAIQAKTTYHQLNLAMTRNLVASCHDLSDGGLAVGLLESQFAGGFGMKIDLKPIPKKDIEKDAELLFSETNSRFIVTCDPKEAKNFEKCMQGVTMAKIGLVRKDKKFIVTGLKGNQIIDEDINDLKKAWQNG